MVFSYICQKAVLDKIFSCIEYCIHQKHITIDIYFSRHYSFIGTHFPTHFSSCIQRESAQYCSQYGIIDIGEVAQHVLIYVPTLCTSFNNIPSEECSFLTYVKKRYLIRSSCIILHSSGTHYNRHIF